MTKPQQPELARSGHTPADPSSAKGAVKERPAAKGDVGRIPEENLPGHHPEVEQDKPKVKVKAPLPVDDATTGRSMSGSPKTRFPFAFEARLLPAAMSVAVTPRTAQVRVEGGNLLIRFGWWRLKTPLTNVSGAQITGPYHWWKVAGPPHVSLADRGVTFATATRRGVCIRFESPVRAIDPLGLLRHPSATVTVEDPEGLVAALVQARGQATA